MLDKEYYINAKSDCMKRYRIVNAGFVNCAKECLSTFEEIVEDKRKEEDYVALAKNLSVILATAEDMCKDILDRIEYCDRQLGINAEEDETAEPAKVSEDSAEGEDGTH